ncbi:hypothetical protein A8B84_10325 [Marinobacter sp. EhC06]|uniref:hypothetical protein n=1 Tax=Marinobacter TaxID=2742 RepID=UPI0007DA20E3|nr:MULTISPECIES: hypothetical protein [unclassified Marinobacter]OAN88966.1 hypothetical protein A8B80_08530 [Marinobacter sp. EhN04]OAN91949.1 hypothetical protein A8B84_10325 [Marinobacter sp. EhC06]
MNNIRRDRTALHRVLICHRSGYQPQIAPALAVPLPAVALAPGVGLPLPLLTYRHRIGPPT